MQTPEFISGYLNLYPEPRSISRHYEEYLDTLTNIQTPELTFRGSDEYPDT